MNGRYSIYGIALLFALTVCLALPVELGQTQETTADEAQLTPGATFTVTTTANSGSGSLRQAILDANNNVGADTINFNIPGGGFQTIPILTRLVAGVGETVTIDGTTQPGYAGTPQVIIDGVSASAGHECLTLQGNSTVKGLAFVRCRSNAIQLNTAGNNIVTGNFIGVNPANETDTTSGNVGVGININRTPNNRVGGNTAAERNIMGRNSQGVNIFEVEATGNIVTGNYIGLLSNGTDLAANTFSGVLITSAPSNRVGGSAAGERNVIGGHILSLEAGVKIDGATASGNSVIGNFIGTDATGTLDRGNAEGVRISNAPNTIVGGTAGTTPGGACTGSCNLISASRTQGVSIVSGASGCVVEGNFFNLNANGTALLAAATTNQSVNINGAGGNRIGGSAAASRNVIVNSGANGNNISIFGTSATTSNNVVIGNFIGTDTTGTLALGNAQSGVNIGANAAVANTRIGGTTAGERNVISGGNRTGILIGTSNQTIVSGNYIGTNASGTADLGNTEDGIRIQGGTNSSIGTATGTTLGGACTGGCNLISGNDRDGVRIVNMASTGNRVDYNYIGLNAAGTAALRNGVTAVDLFGTQNNVIGKPLSTALSPPQTVDTAPETIQCLQDDESGDYIQFNDITGEFLAVHCRSGVGRSGRGEFSVDGGISYLNGPGTAVTTFVNRGSAVFDLPFSPLQTFGHLSIKDSNRSDSTCECPTEGLQTFVGEIKLGVDAPNPANGNVVNNVSSGTDAKGRSILSNPGEKGVNILQGGNNTLNNLEVGQSGFPSLNVRSGTGNGGFGGSSFGFSPFGGLRPSRDGRDSDAVTFSNFLPVDLNDNGILDPNDPQDADSGANNTQNHAVNLKATRLPNGSVRFTGNLNSTPNGSFVLDPYSVEASIVGPDPNAIAFEIYPIAFATPIQVTANGNGDAAIDRTFTDVDAAQIKFGEYITAKVRVIAPPANAGDVSEMSPPAVVPTARFDFDDDGRTDISITRPGANNGPSNWYILHSSDSTARVQQFGLGDDRLVAGDFQGDQVTDFAVWRPSNGTWFNSRLTGNPSTNFDSIPWGVSSDIPVVGDFLDLGSNQQAVFRPSEGNWYIRNPIDNSAVVQNFGVPTDKPVPADYNGDGRTDVAIYRNGQWWISVCPSCAVRVDTWGLATDVPVPGDYDGDGKADLAVWRPSDGIWYIVKSTGGFVGYQWGTAGDKPVNGDFDGDGMNDIAVWRPSNGTWYIIKSNGGGFLGFIWGQNGDIPVPVFPNAP